MLLGQAGLAAKACESIPALVSELDAGAAFVVVTEEAVATADLSTLAAWLGNQEEWSDFPFVLLTSRGGGLERNPAARRSLQILGNVTFLERPFHPTTFISLAQSALRARRRQYEARQHLEDLRASEEKFRAAVNAVQGVVWTNDPSGQMRGEQPGWAALTGQSREQYEGFGWSSAVHPDDAQATIDAWNEAVRARTTFIFEHRVRRRDWKWGHFSIRGVPVLDARGNIKEWVGVHTDVTEAREAENALREETRILDTLNRTGAAIAAELDLHSLVQTVTDAGVSLVGAAFGAFFYNVVNETGERLMLYALSGADRSFFDKFGMPRATDVFKPTFLGVGVVRSDDILADPRYGKSGPHFGMPKGHLPVRSYLAVPVTSRSGEVIGGLFFGHPEPGRFEDRHERLITGIAGQAAVAIDNARLYQALQLSNDTLEQRVSDEIARRSAAEDALRQAQKMEAIGQLTGGVAHDFNNLLMAILGNLELLQKHIRPDPRVTRLIEGAVKGAQRGAALTQRLLAFARRQELTLEPRRLTDIVKGMTELLERSLGTGIELELKLPADVPLAMVDDNQLELAILNLAVNARDAMTDGGRLTLEVDVVSASGEAGERQYVRLSISDTGQGMSKDVLQKATEPFFSTKGVGKGTGLGLSMVHGLAIQLDGTLRLSSSPGKGTRAEIWLPTSGTAEPIETKPNPVQIQGTVTPARAIRRILAVDDDSLILMSMADMLEDLGHKVVEASSGAQAIDLLLSDETIDLMITDFSMPKMNGAQLAEAARQIRSDLPILVATGYAELPAGENLNLPRIGKPYSQEQLSAEIQKLLPQ